MCPFKKKNSALKAYADALLSRLDMAHMALESAESLQRATYREIEEIKRKRIHYDIRSENNRILIASGIIGRNDIFTFILPRNLDPLDQISVRLST